MIADRHKKNARDYRYLWLKNNRQSLQKEKQSLPTRNSIISQILISLFITWADAVIGVSSAIAFDVNDNVGVLMCITERSLVMSHTQSGLAFHIITCDRLETFITVVTEIIYRKIMHQSDPNMTHDTFLNKILNSYENHIPHKKLRKLRIRKPSISPDELRQI